MIVSVNSLRRFNVLSLIVRSREIATTDDHYVKWTQWIFLQLYKKGLASQSEVSVNWCPKLGMQCLVVAGFSIYIVR